MTENLENVNRKALMKSTQKQNSNTKKKIWEGYNLESLRRINNFVFKPKWMVLDGLPSMKLGKKHLFVQTSWMLSFHPTFR